MPTIIEITGKPIITLEFFDLMTWNRFSAMHQKTQWNVKANARREGARLAAEAKRRLPKHIRRMLLVNRAFLLVRVLPPKEEVSDTHNVAIKNTIDGFKDAGVWVDDEWSFVPAVMFMFGGIDQDVQWKGGKGWKRSRKTGKVTRTRKAPKRRTIIEVHELGQIIINGHSQSLPIGRQSNKAGSPIVWAIWEALADKEEW